MKLIRKERKIYDQLIIIDQLTTSPPGERGWSEKGCETRPVYNAETGVTDVECICDHLTSFAVLMVNSFY